MKELKETLFNNSKRVLTFLLLSLLLFAMPSCLDSLDSEGESDDPIASLISIFADTVSGNGSDVGAVRVSSEALPPGSQIEFSTNPICLFNADPVLDNNGDAFANFLGPIFILDGATLLEALESEEGLLSVAVSEPIVVKITTSEGLVQSKVGSATILPTGIIPPENTELEVPVPDMGVCPAIVGLTLEFAAVGLPDGTEVNFTLSNPALGVLNPTSAQVTGGSVVTEYSVPDCQAGTQVVTASAILPNPFDIDPACPNVPEANRTIQEIMVITQTQAQPSPSPTPTPTPTPSP